MNTIYEKAGLFYLGKDVDKQSFKPTEILTLLKNKNFTTHAAIIGMTGSGKTGLGIDIIEEAAIDNIPSIVIDPKGDMGDLCLTDPDFKAKNFEPWVKDDAIAKGEDPLEYATKVASTWKKGIEDWGQDSKRVARFQKVRKTIYTPGSNAGIPIDLASTLSMPNKTIMDDSDSFASYLKSAVMGLLSLVQIDADPLSSREYILLSQILSHAWMDGKSLGIEDLVGRVINPPFKKIGVLALESFYSSADRFKLASKFNAIIASPSFMNWLKGEALDIQNMLYDDDGKAKIAIFSISHLNDDEKMFFVTLLLNKVTAWMRLQSGSNRLRALLYMDEIYGFFPPVKNPPSKEPMITLLKQARAYGLGIVLSTQNPVDLDYKGLSNIGTWCIGRLQTTQDIDRVIDGLGGKVGSKFDKKEIETMLANLQKRVFFLKSAHLDDIRLFSTRWAMSYLKGPLKKDEISKLMQSQKSSADTTTTQSSVTGQNGATFSSINTLDSSIKQYFEIDISGTGRYSPSLGAKTKIYYNDTKRNIDMTKEAFVYLKLSGEEDVDWNNVEENEDDYTTLPSKAPSNAKFAPLPQYISTDKALKKNASNLISYLYRTSSLELYKCPALKIESGVEDTLGKFKIVVRSELSDRKEEAIDELKNKYGKKEQRLLDQLSRAKERVKKEKGEQVNSILNVGVSILGALFGRTSSSKIGTAISRGSRAYKEHGDVSRAEQKAIEIQDKIDDLSDELEGKIDDINDQYSIDNYEIESFFIKPKKRDIMIDGIAIVWKTA